MNIMSLKIDQLLLDSNNPRIGEAKNQVDALQKIISDQGDKLAKLAEDIASEGLNPMDRLLVVRAKKSTDIFVVVDGNRRLAALRILSNSAILGGIEIESSLRKKMEASAKKFDRKTVEPISVSCEDSREAAAKWIHLRHTGANEGRGVVDWNGLARARFRGASPSLQALEFVKQYGDLDQSQMELLEDFPITTMDRLLSSKKVRDLIGVDVKSGKLMSGLPAKELIKPLRRLVVDLAEKKINVSNLKNVEQQETYIKSIDKGDMPSLKKMQTVRDIEDIKETDAKPKTAASAKTTSKRSTNLSDRKTLIPKAVKLNITHARVADICKELKGLPLDTYANSCAVLFRVFLELSVDHYFKTNKIDLTFKDKNGQKRDKPLGKKVTELIDDLVKNKNCSIKDFSAVNRAVSDKKSPLSIDLLHDYVHNLFHTPKARDLRSAWDDSEPFFKKIWE